MKDIIIIGAGGFGREVAWLIEDINNINKEWNIVGFVDDNANAKDENLNGYELVGDIDWLMNQSYYVTSAIGNPSVNKKIMDKLATSENKYATLIHPSVICSDTSSIGEGSIICAGNIITVNATIGKHVIINLDSTIGHDATINDYTVILPSVNVSGHVVLEKGVSVGTGSAIIQGLTVGENTIIGAGSVVVKDLPANCTAVGSPAKPIKFHNE